MLPLPLSALKSASPVWATRRTSGRAVPLTYDQFRYAFANAVSEDEAAGAVRHLRRAGPGAPLFQAATANLNPWTEAKVETDNADRGPLLIMSGEKDHTVPVVDRQRLLQAAEAQPGRHRDRRDRRTAATR